MRNASAEDGDRLCEEKGNRKTRRGTYDVNGGTIQIQEILREILSEYKELPPFYTLRKLRKLGMLKEPVGPP